MRILLNRYEPHLTVLGRVLENTNRHKEAKHIYEITSEHYTDIKLVVRDTPAYRYWIENLLARHCVLSGGYVALNSEHPLSVLTRASMFRPYTLLLPFREWAKFWERSQAADLRPTLESNGSTSRHNIWKSYYETLSVFVQNDVVIPLYATRLEQALELKRVESIYEQMLLQRNNFPKANEATPEIESWVDLVMANWRSMTGPAWKDKDLGTGGKISVGRGILEVSLSTSFKHCCGAARKSHVWVDI